MLDVARYDVFQLAKRCWPADPTFRPHAGRACAARAQRLRSSCGRSPRKRVPVVPAARQAAGDACRNHARGPGMGARADLMRALCGASRLRRSGGRSRACCGSRPHGQGTRQGRGLGRAGTTRYTPWPVRRSRTVGPESRVEFADDPKPLLRLRSVCGALRLDIQSLHARRRAASAQGRARHGASRHGSQGPGAADDGRRHRTRHATACSPPTASISTTPQQRAGRSDDRSAHADHEDRPPWPTACERSPRLPDPIGDISELK